MRPYPLVKGKKDKKQGDANMGKISELYIALRVTYEMLCGFAKLLI